MPDQSQIDVSAGLDSLLKPLDSHRCENGLLNEKRERYAAYWHSSQAARVNQFDLMCRNLDKITTCLCQPLDWHGWFEILRLELGPPVVDSTLD